MLRHGMQSHSNCPLCEQALETADHLALGCVLSREVWHATLQRCNLSHLMPLAGDMLIEWWPDSRRRVPQQLRRGFDSLVLLVVWTLWKERNNRVFERSAETARGICKRITEEVELWKLSDAVGLGNIWR
ncbi:uncharacterized protein [Lolium perenne]|uniref:uncharacterized protein n=1 Tax=Lolium perenne TaxID=4522 RepID=UPI003A9A579A